MNLSRAVGCGVAATGIAGAAWWWRHHRSRVVQNWTPGGGRRHRSGPLAVRTLGTGGHVIVLLHGLVASGDTFGGAYDALATGAHVVIPDLLGFGQSMDQPSDDFSLEAHTHALDAMLVGLGLDGMPLTIVGHSMGAVLALHWAASREETQRVVTLCAPLYDDEAEARGHIRRMGMLARFFAMESPIARWTCAWMCRYRRLAAWISVAIAPHWPVAIARNGVRHTWESYLGGMNGIILGAPWRAALADLDARGVAVRLVEGARDAVPVAGRAAALAASHTHVVTAEHPLGDHDLPLAFADWTAAQVSG